MYLWDYIILCRPNHLVMHQAVRGHLIPHAYIEGWGFTLFLDSYFAPKWNSCIKKSEIHNAHFNLPLNSYCNIFIGKACEYYY